MNRLVADLNAGFRTYQREANACPTDDAHAFATCLLRAGEISHVESNVVGMRRYVKHLEGRLDSGQCDSSLDPVDDKLGALQQVLRQTKHDAVGPSPSIWATVSGTYPAWVAYVKAEHAWTRAC
jgi:hypothetical protein